MKVKDPKNVIIIGNRAAELLEELSKRFPLNMYGVTVVENGFEPAPTTVVIFLTTKPAFKRTSNEAFELAKSSKARTYVIDCSNQSLEQLVDKASAFLEAI